MPNTTMSRTTRLGTVGALSLAALGLAGCGTSGPETGTDVEDVQEENVVEEPTAEETAVEGTIYDGVYDRDFYDDLDSYERQSVTVSAEVNEIISPSSFTIAGTDETTVEALLVVHDKQLSELQPELTVKVTGTVHKAFDLPTVEEETGLDLEDELYEEWDGEPYIQATEVDTSVAAD
jgi:hypothetical protein